MDRKESGKIHENKVEELLENGLLDACVVNIFLSSTEIYM